MLSDPVSRLELAQREIDKAFGPNFAASHPELVAAVMASAASDWAASVIAAALRDVAAAWMVGDDDPLPQASPGIVRASSMPRPR
jgi:hypothetical protein